MALHSAEERWESRTPTEYRDLQRLERNQSSVAIPESDRLSNLSEADNRIEPFSGRLSRSGSILFSKHGSKNAIVT